MDNNLSLDSTSESNFDLNGPGNLARGTRNMVTRPQGSAYPGELCDTYEMRLPFIKGQLTRLKTFYKPKSLFLFRDSIGLVK